MQWEGINVYIIRVSRKSKNGAQSIWRDSCWKISKMAKDTKPHIEEVL